MVVCCQHCFLFCRAISILSSSSHCLHLPFDSNRELKFLTLARSAVSVRKAFLFAALILPHTQFTVCSLSFPFCSLLSAKTPTSTTDLSVQLGNVMPSTASGLQVQVPQHGSCCKPAQPAGSFPSVPDYPIWAFLYPLHFFTVNSLISKPTSWLVSTHASMRGSWRSMAGSIKGGGRSRDGQRVGVAEIRL